MGALPVAGIYLRRGLSNKAFKFYVLINSVVLVCIVVSAMELEHNEQKLLYILAVLFSLASYSFLYMIAGRKLDAVYGEKSKDATSLDDANSVA